VFIASSQAVAELMQPTLKGMSVVHPGIPLNPPVPSADVVTLKRQLGLGPTDGPVFLLGGEGPNAHYDLALWTAAIVQHLFTGIRTLVREDARHFPNLSLERFFHTLADENMLVVAPPDIPWSTLVHAADVLLVTAADFIPVGSILAAMAAGVPVVSTPTPSIRCLLEHDHNALVAVSTGPRALAAQLENLLTTATLGPRLAENARKEIASDFTAAQMVAGFEACYVSQSQSVAPA
jgi:glycosyltransferase involved in cell wall biosynthesis